MTSRWSIRRVAFGAIALLFVAHSCEFNRSGVGAGERCGNGIADPGEQCDGADLGGATCQSLGHDGGTLGCNPINCMYDTSGCFLLSCGNGTIDPGEDCEGTNLDGKTCQNLGYDWGTLACTANCAFDTMGCAYDTCGNGAIDAGEQCDGNNLNGLTCQDMMYYGGQLLCTATCYYDLTDCQAHGRCGDSTRNATYGEECDGPDLGGQDCTDHGFYGGQLACTNACTFDLSGCTGECGDGIRNGPEDCDGSALGGATCQSLGFDYGSLACTTSCTYNTSGCDHHQCGDGIIGPGEDCDGNNLNNQTCQLQGYYGGVLTCTASCDFNLTDCQASGWCGDGVRNGPEVCDGSDTVGQDCVSLGYVSGTLGCAPDCMSFDVAQCRMAGLGEPCEQDSDCESNLCLDELSAGFPEGMCSTPCGTCQPNQVCAFLPWVSGSYCLPDCSSACRDGYACFNPYGALSGAVCTPHCESDGQCAVSLCNEWRGLCDIPVNGSNNGAACTSDNTCRGRHCQTGGDWTGGYCMSPCSLDSGFCPGDGVCMDHSGGAWADMGLCYDGCVNSGDCRSSDYDCSNEGPNNEGVCVPK